MKNLEHKNDDGKRYLKKYEISSMVSRINSCKSLMRYSTSRSMPDKVFQTSGMHQKRTLVKLCFEGFTVQNQKLTPIWTPVFDVLMDVQLANFDRPKVVGKGSKTLAVPKVLTWTSGGVFWTKFEYLLSKTRIPNSEIQSLGRAKRKGSAEE